MRALWLGLALSLCATWAPAQFGGRQPARKATPEEPTIPSSVRIRVQQDLVTAEVRNAPLQRVLRELAGWTGVVFEVEAQENPSISIRLNAVPLERAIERITQSSNSIIYYESDALGRNRVSYVRVFSRNRPNTPVSLEYIGTGKVTKTEADAVDDPEQALSALQGSSNAEARQKAVEVLVDARHPSAAAALTKALQDQAAEVRVAALEGLVALGARPSLPEILKALKDEHPAVRQSAIIAVSLLGDQQNVRDLSPLLRDRDRSVAATAEREIRKLGARRP